MFHPRRATIGIATLAFCAILAACGGGGGGGGSVPSTGGGGTTPTPGSTATPTPTATATPTQAPTPTINAVLVGSNPSGAAPSIVAYAPNFSSGTVLYTISGSNTGFAVGTTINAMAVGSDGNLYVLDSVKNGSADQSEVRVFAATAQGNAAPIRIIPTTNTALNPTLPAGFTGAPAVNIALDASNNLYVSFNAAPQFVVFAAGSSGNAAPIRTITTTDNGVAAIAQGMYVNADGSIVSLIGPQQIGTTTGMKFAANANGSPTPTATFIPYSSNDTLDAGAGNSIVADSSGTVYIGVLGFPAGPGGAQRASGILPVPIADQTGRQQTPTAIYDSTLTTMYSPAVMQVLNGLVYAVDQQTKYLLAYSTTANGQVPPVMQLQLSSFGPAVLLTTPYDATSAMHRKHR